MRLSLRALFGNAAILMAGTVGGAILAFSQSVIVTKALGPAQFGVWGAITAYAAIVQAFFGFRTDEALTRHLVDVKAEAQRGDLERLLAIAMAVNALSAVGSTLVIAGGAGWIATLVGGASVAPLYALFGLTVLLSFSDGVWNSIARDQQRFQAMAFLPTAVSAMQLVGCGILWTIGRLDLASLTWLAAGLAVIRASLQLGMLDALLRDAYGLHLVRLPWWSVWGSWRTYQGFWRFLVAGYAAGSVSSVVKNADVLILGAVRPEAEVGLYRLAKSLVVMIQTASSALSSAMFQDLSALSAARRFEELARGLARMSRVWIPGLVVGSAIAMVASPTVIGWVYGTAYAGAALPFQVLLAGVVVSMALFWAPGLLLALKQLRAYFRISLANGLLFLVLNAWLTPLWGAAGAAACLGASWAFGAVAAMWLSWRAIGAQVPETQRYA